MFVQCPSCGTAGNGDNFRLLGNHKILCGTCKSVLDIGYICPECGEFMSNILPVDQSQSLVQKIRILVKKGYWPTLKPERECGLCRFKASPDDFKPVVRTRERYSVMVF
jgi:hypothetical protein